MDIQRKFLRCKRKKNHSFVKKMENLTGIDGKAVWIRNWRKGVGQRWVVEEITWWHGVDKLIGCCRLGVHGYHIYIWRLANTSNSFQKSLPDYKSLRNTNEQPPWKGGINSRTQNDFVAWSKAFLFTRTSLKILNDFPTWHCTVSPYFYCSNCFEDCAIPNMLCNVMGINS